MRPKLSVNWRAITNETKKLSPDEKREFAQRLLSEADA